MIFLQKVSTSQLTGTWTHEASFYPANFAAGLWRIEVIPMVNREQVDIQHELFDSGAMLQRSIEATAQGWRWTAEWRVHFDPRQSPPTIEAFFVASISGDENELTREVAAEWYSTLCGLLPDTSYRFVPVPEPSLAPTLWPPLETPEYLALHRPLQFMPYGDFSRPRSLGKIHALQLERSEGDLRIRIENEARFLPYVTPFAVDNRFDTLLWRAIETAQHECWVRIAIGGTTLCGYELAYFEQLHRLASSRRDNVPSLTSARHYVYAAQVAATQSDDAHRIAAALVATHPEGWSYGSDPRPIDEVRDDWELAQIPPPEALVALPGLDNATFAEKAEARRDIEDHVDLTLRRMGHLLRIEERDVWHLPVADESGSILNSLQVRPFHRPQQTFFGPRKIHLGQIYVGQREAGAFEICTPSLKSHVLIVGKNGSGKSTTGRQLLAGCFQHLIPFAGLCPAKAQDHVDGLRELGIPVRRIHLHDPYLRDGEGLPTQADPDFLRWNPLEPLPGARIHEHIAAITTALLSLSPTYGVMDMIFKGALAYLYRSEGFDLYAIAKAGQKWPLMSQLIPAMETFLQHQVSAKEQDEFVKPWVRRLTYMLQSSVLGDMMRPERWTDYATLQANEAAAQAWHSLPKDQRSPHPDIRTGNRVEPDMRSLFEQPIVFDLEGLDEATRAFIACLLLTYLRQHREAQGPSSDLRHLLMIEEAANIFKSSLARARSTGEGASTSDDASSLAINLLSKQLSEIRFVGQGIVIVDQMPSRLSEDCLGNTFLKIAHQMDNPRDVTEMAQAMALSDDQKRVLLDLERGEAVVKNGSLKMPVLVQMPWSTKVRP